MENKPPEPMPSTTAAIQIVIAVELIATGNKPAIIINMQLASHGRRLFEFLIKIDMIKEKIVWMNVYAVTTTPD